MKHAKVTAVGFAVLSVTIAGLAIAQPAGQPARQPASQPTGQPAGQPAGDTPQVNRRVQAQVDRMMANDKNADAKLERDELPARLADRLFAEADTDQDGFITREELIVHFGGQAPAGAPATDAAPSRTGQPTASADDAFEGAMKQAGGTMRAIRGSEFAPETRDSDLDAAQSMQEAMVAAKASYTTVAMSPLAVEQFGTDEVAYRTAFRLALIESLRAAIDIEQAVLEGDQPAALAARTRLMDSQKAAHNLFQE